MVVGSLNMDLVLRVPHLPAPDETLHGHGVAEHLGGKGANQAVAAARLGAAVTMVGAVGDDPHGHRQLEALRAEGIDVSFVAVRSQAPTGLAVIPVADDGQVSIIVVAGANATVTPADVERAAAPIAEAEVVLLQGEIPADAARRAAELARGTVVLNPAPVNDVASAVLPLAGVVIVNRHEAAALAPLPAGATVVTTLGADGALIDTLAVPSFAASVVDATGAGDAFSAAVAVRLAEGAAPAEAARFACAAGSLAVEVQGAQPSMPQRSAVEARLLRG